METPVVHSFSGRKFIVEGRQSVRPGIYANRADLCIQVKRSAPSRLCKGDDMSRQFVLQPDLLKRLWFANPDRKEKFCQDPGFFPTQNAAEFRNNAGQM